MIRSEIVRGLPDYEITDLQIRGGGIHISARYTGPRSCPHCGRDRLRNKGRYQRRVRHENWGLRHCVLELEASKFQCQDCGRYFRQRFPGIQPCQRSSEAFQKMIFRQAPGRDQSQSSGPAGRHWCGHGGTLLSAWTPAPVRRMAFHALPAGAGHRRALLYAPQRLCHHAV